MDYISDKKIIIGQIFFVLSVLMLGYMLISPLNQIIGNFNEYFTLTVTNFPMGDLWHIIGGDSNPPLYYLLIKVITKLANILGLNQSLFYILKLFSIVPYAIILIVSILKLKKDYGWFTIGLFTFSIAVMSEFFTHYMFLRPYSWAVLFLVLTFIYYKDVIYNNDRKSWILFTLFTILGSYCHYYILISSVCLYLALIYFFHNTDNENRNLMISIIAFIVAYAPWIPSLLGLLDSIFHSFNAPNLTLEYFIKSLSYFAYSNDTFFSVFTLLLLILILFLSRPYCEKLDFKEKFYIYSGIGLYFMTIILLVILSFMLNPLLIVSGLLAVSAVLWLMISIILNKIENRKIFLFSLIIIILLLVSGIGNMLTNSDSIYTTGMEQQKIIDEIIADNDSVTVITSPGLAMYLLEYANQTEMYCINQSYIYGENIDRIHEIYNFKTINQDEIDDFAMNNSGKNIYLASWNNQDLNLKTNTTLKTNEFTISKVDITPTEDEYYY